MATKKLGAACTICRFWRRKEVEAQLTSGRYSVRAVARAWDFDAETLRRHVRAHVDPDVREAMRGTPGVCVASVGARLADAADAAHEIRVDAAASGQDFLALNAIRVEIVALNNLADRLGIEGSDGIEAVRVLDDLQHAVALAAQGSAAVQAAVVSELRKLDQWQLADDLASIQTKPKEISA